MSKVTLISFDVLFRGQGIVNRNGAGERHREQYSFAKRAANNKPFVSKDCILATALEEPFCFGLLSRSSVDLDRLEVNMNKLRILRGNMDASKGANLRRKSPLMMTDALPTENCSSFSEYNYSTCEMIAHGKGGNPFYEDHVLETEFRSRVALNLSELQFISTNSAFGAPNIEEGIFAPSNEGHDQIKRIWDENFPNTPFPAIAFYRKGRPGSLMTTAYQTRGVKLSNKEVAVLAEFLISSFENFVLQKNSGYLEFFTFENVSINTSDGPIALKDIAELRDRIRSDSFEVNSFYEHTTDVKDYSDIEKLIREENIKREKAKKEADAARAATKAAANAAAAAQS